MKGMSNFKPFPVLIGLIISTLKEGVVPGLSVTGQKLLSHVSVLNYKYCFQMQDIP